MMGFVLELAFSYIFIYWCIVLRNWTNRAPLHQKIGKPFSGCRKKKKKRREPYTQ